MTYTRLKDEHYMRFTIARAIALHRDAYAAEAYRQAQVHDDYAAMTANVNAKAIAQGMTDTLKELRKLVTTGTTASVIADWTRDNTARVVLAAVERKRLVSALRE